MESQWVLLPNICRHISLCVQQRRKNLKLEQVEDEQMMAKTSVLVNLHFNNQLQKQSQNLEYK